MANPIVTILVSQQTAPLPATLQRTGAIISQGGTTLAKNSTKLLTQLADLTSVLTGALALSSLTWSGGTVTATTAAPHGWTNGDVIPVVINGAAPTGYNGTFQATVTGANTFTYPLVANPGSETTPGTVLEGDEPELLNAATTFFAQGNGANTAVYVLELGEGTAAEGITALTTYLTNNPNQFYSFLVPNEWDGVTAFITLAKNNAALDSKLYFHVNTTTQNYAGYSGVKSILWYVPSPTAVATEFTAAAGFWATLKYNPSSTNKVTPLAWTYLNGVTAWPATGYNSTLTAVKAAGGNYVGTGAEGGISNTLLVGGFTADAKPFNYWYSADWAQINVQRNLANAVINGSNDPLNPLLYNQSGINTLQTVASATFSTGVTYGLATGTVTQTSLSIADFDANLNAGQYTNQLVVNAEPFLAYTSENPSDYAAQTYAGLTGQWIPQLGFGAITFNLGVTEFV